MTKHPLALLLALTACALPLRAQELKWDATDLGPFHTGCFKINGQVTAKGIAIKVGDNSTVLFDPELLRVSAAWTGGFIKFPRGRGGLEGQISAAGEVKFSTPYLPGWSTGEIGDDPRDKHQGHLPAGVAKYRGLYDNGDKVVLSYTNRPVQSLPQLFVPLGDPAVPIHCRFVEPGDYGFRTTDRWETDHGRPVLKFGMDAVVPAKPLRSTAPRGTVVILHGYALDKTVMAPWGFFLAEQGYRCVLVDLRGHGRSGGRQIHFGPLESRDMTELLTRLARLGHVTGPVGVLGDSYGAAIALRWAATDPRVETVVAMAPYARLSTAMEGIRQTYAKWVPATWVQAAAKDLPGLLAESSDALDTTSIAGRISVPVLFVAGGRDRVAPVGDVRELQRAVVADSRAYGAMATTVLTRGSAAAQRSAIAAP